MIIEISKITNDYEIIFALDPSTDNTESVILKAIEKNKKIKLLVFFQEDSDSQQQQWRLSKILKVIDV